MKHASELSIAELHEFGRAAGREAVVDAFENNVSVVGMSNGQITAYLPPTRIEADRASGQSFPEARKALVREDDPDLESHDKDRHG